MSISNVKWEQPQQTAVRVDFTHSVFLGKARSGFKNIGKYKRKDFYFSFMLDPLLVLDQKTAQKTAVIFYKKMCVKSSSGFLHTHFMMVLFFLYILGHIYYSDCIRNVS